MATCCGGPHVGQAGVGVTNYGLLLSYAASPCAFEKAIEPWGAEVAEGLKRCREKQKGRKGGRRAAAKGAANEA
jgi:hypothetical protein